jgi:hexokinase
MSSKLMSPALTVLKFERDFALEPLAIGTAVLGNLPDGFVVQSARLQEVSAITSTATLALGEDGAGDADGYLVAVDPAATQRCHGALLGASGADLEHVVDAAKDGVLITAAVANVVAGKIAVYFQGYQQL